MPAARSGRAAPGLPSPPTPDGAGVRLLLLSSLSFGILALSAGCGGYATDEDSADDKREAYSTGARSWVIPPEVVARGDRQHVARTGASRCVGGLTAGATRLQRDLGERFAQIQSIGGYACRNVRGGRSLSVHAAGRALDLMIRPVNGRANSAAGDPIGNWLIENAAAIGIQYIIWNRTRWNGASAPGAKVGRYSGADAHVDHLHIELSVEGGRAATPFFTGGAVTTPGEPAPAQTPQSCPAIAPAGGEISEDGPCFEMFGRTQFWRSVSGEGRGGSLLWTNAFQGDSPGNWARWHVHLAQAGDYEVQYFSTSRYAVHRSVRYGLRHAGRDQVIAVDQRTGGDGWRSLGTYRFAAGGDQHLSVFDNEPQAVGANQHIVVDAIRLVPRTVAPEPQPEEPEPQPEEPEPQPEEPEPQPQDGDAPPSSFFDDGDRPASQGDQRSSVTAGTPTDWSGGNGGHPVPGEGNTVEGLAGCALAGGAGGGAAGAAPLLVLAALAALRNRRRARVLGSLLPAAPRFVRADHSRVKLPARSGTTTGATELKALRVTLRVTFAPRM